MEIIGMHHLGLTVTNLQRSLEYYKRMFGLEPEFVATGDGEELSQAVGVPEAKLTFAFLRLGNGTVELLEYDNDRQTQYGLRNSDVGAPHLCFDVADIDAAYTELLAKGADFYSVPLRITDGPLAGCAFAYNDFPADWEERVDLARLRADRLARLRAQLDRSELGALLSFDFANIRYMTATHIGTWAMDKLIRFALLPRGGDPVIWDFGSAARHHQLYNPWLDHTAEGAARSGARAGISTLRGAFHPDAGIAAEVARQVAAELREHGLADAPLGIDMAEMPVLAALRAEGIDCVDGQQVFLEARRIKTSDEISLLAQACSMVDAAYQELYEFLRPGVRENECVGLVSKVLYDRGSEYVEGVNAISGERCSPHPHVYSDRLIRPGDPAFFDILHSHLGYRTCYYRTFAVGSASRAQRDAYIRCREYMDSAIALVKPGATTADIVSLWPTAEEFGFPDETAAFALQYGHGVGLSIWEKPIFSRLVSLDHPETLEQGMVFALETYWPAADGWSAARIEEEVVVTADGCEVITKFPAEELLVAGRKYWTAGGALDTLRESQSHLNTPAGRGERAGGAAGTR